MFELFRHEGYPKPCDPGEPYPYTTLNKKTLIRDVGVESLGSHTLPEREGPNQEPT